MTFKEVLAAVIDWLRQDKRITYRALQRQFDLDDAYLSDLKDELIEAKQIAQDENDRVLVWTGETGSPEPDARRGTEDERHFQALLPAVIGLLQGQRRVTYRTLKYVFGIDDALLDDIREELTFRQVARDEGDEGMVWTGETQLAMPPVVDVPSPSAPTPSPVTEIPTNGPTAATETIATDAPLDESTTPSESARSTPEAERRQLTVMFCDLADSTKLSQELDPEDLREVIRAYQQTSAEVIQRFDGYIAQHLGDGLLIYFGWPRAHEDDAQRALHAGLGIVEAITTTLNPRLEQEKGVELTVRLGIHTGPVVVGEMGGGDRLESLATGETVNIAARLEGLAQANTVVVSRVTERLVQGAFVLEKLGLQMLKGVAEAMEIFRVIKPLDTDRDEDKSLPDGGVFLVGRDEEFGLLLRRWEQAKESLGQVVLISGEAGIGKSSAVATVRHHVVEEGHTRITFRCSPYHTNSALYPVITHLEQVLGFERDDTSGTKLDKLEQVLRTTTLSLEESVPLVATLLSVPLEDRYHELTLSPQQQRQQTLDTLVAWLMEESEKRPMLSVWEDLHWADPSTLEMLGLVLEQTPTVPMLHLLTFRPEFTPPWPTRSHMTPITLNRLERPQVEALIAHMTGDKILPAEVVEHIVTKTDGVPLYVEELTKMLLTSGLLQEEAEQYVLTGPLSSVAIPDTLQDSLMARLDQMHTAKEIAQLAAVIGREFAYEMLQAVSPQDEELLQASLGQLVGAELLYQRGRPPRAQYIFKHALIQDAASTSLLRSQRQQYHQQIAQVLEEQFPETGETQPEMLAHHYTQAGLMEQAVDYWERAGAQATRASANAEAIAYLRKSLEVLTTLPETSERYQRELALHLALGPPLRATLGSGAIEVEQTYSRARDLCHGVGSHEQLFEALIGLANFYGGRSELETAIELCEQCLGLAQQLQDGALQLRAHTELTQHLYFLPKLVSARTHVKQALFLYDREQNDAEAYRALVFRTGINPKERLLAYNTQLLWYLGYPDQAMRSNHKALALGQELAHPFALVNSLLWSAIMHHYCGDIHTVFEHAKAATDLAIAHGFEERLSLGRVLQGSALAMQDDREDGVLLLRQGLAWNDGRTKGASHPYRLGLLAEAYSSRGQIEDGLMTVAEALHTIEETHSRIWEAELYRIKGTLLLGQAISGHKQAEACFHQALALAQRQQTKSLELRAATSLARLWQAQDKRQDAHDLLAPVYEWFTEGFDTADLIDAKALLDELSEDHS